jgi:hypothetical protein
MTQALYAHMNNKTIKKIGARYYNSNRIFLFSVFFFFSFFKMECPGCLYNFVHNLENLLLLLMHNILLLLVFYMNIYTQYMFNFLETLAMPSTLEKVSHFTVLS